MRAGRRDGWLKLRRQALAVRHGQRRGAVLGAACGRAPWLIFPRRCQQSGLAPWMRYAIFRFPLPTVSSSCCSADRRRQDNDPTADCGSGAARSWQRGDPRQGCHHGSAGGARTFAFVFQQYSLYPHLTVYDNLAFPLRSPARRMDEGLVRRRGATGRRAPAYRAEACQIAPRPCPAAKCSGWRSAARWCASLRSI